MWKQRFIKVRDVLRKVAADPRFKWYQRGIWVVTAVWAAVVVAQSVSYYTYIGNGRTAQAEGRYREAEEMFDLALKDVKSSISFAVVGGKDSRYANALNNLAEVYRVTGRYGEAEKAYVEVREIVEKQLGKSHQAYPISINNLAALYRDVGRFDEADKLYRQALQAYEKNLGPDNPLVAKTLLGLSDNSRAAGRLENCKPFLERALAITKKTYGTGTPEYATACDAACGYYLDVNDLKAAQQFATQALDIRQKVLPQDHADLATTRFKQAEILRLTGQVSDARPLYVVALKVLENKLGPNHPKTKACAAGLGRL